MSHNDDKKDVPKKGFLRRSFDKATGGFRRLFQRMRQPGLDRALASAARGGYGSRAALLLKQGANPRAHNYAAMRDAAGYGSYDVLRHILDTGICGRDDGNVAFLLAVAAGERDCARLLLQRGADVDADGGLALATSAVRNNLRMTEMLLIWNADPNAQGRLALQKAAASGHQHVVRLLLSRGATVDDETDPAVVAAEQNGWKRCAEILRAAIPKPPSAPPPAPERPQP